MLNRVARRKQGITNGGFIASSIVLTHLKLSFVDFLESPYSFNQNSNGLSDLDTTDYLRSHTHAV